MIASLVFVISALASVRVIGRQLEKAPEGFEDETGFHVVTRPARCAVRRTVRRAAIYARQDLAAAAGVPAQDRSALPVSVA